MTTKRKKPFAANAASLRFLAKQGFIAGTVEKWIPFIKQRKDLFGFGDLVAIDDCSGMEITGAIMIQTTTSANVAARRTKIIAIPAAKKWLERGNTIWIHGWIKKKGHKPTLVVHEVTLGDFK